MNPAVLQQNAKPP